MKRLGLFGLAGSSKPEESCVMRVTISFSRPRPKVRQEPAKNRSGPEGVSTTTLSCPFGSTSLSETTCMGRFSQRGSMALSSRKSVRLSFIAASSFNPETWISPAWPCWMSTVMFPSPAAGQISWRQVPRSSTTLPSIRYLNTTSKPSIPLHPFGTAISR